MTTIVGGGGGGGYACMFQSLSSTHGNVYLGVEHKVATFRLFDGKGYEIMSTVKQQFIRSYDRTLVSIP